MKQTIRIVILGAVVLAVGAAMQPALASCANSIAFTSSLNLNGTDFSYVKTAGVAEDGGIDNTDVSANLRGNFWVLASGAPAGDGHDDGTGNGPPVVGAWPALENGANTPNGATGWVRSGPAGGNYVYIEGNWAGDARVDGCPDAVATQPTCLAIALTDHTGGADSYFAIITKQERSDGNYDLARPGSASYILAPVPKPRITGSSRTGNDVTLQIGAPLPGNLAAGSYLDPACGAAIVSYKVRGRIVPRGSGVGAGRDPAQWTDFQTANIPIALGTSILADCSETTNQDVYLAQTFIYDSGFEATFVSRESTRAECGPQIAQPQQRPSRQPSNIERPGRR